MCGAWLEGRLAWRANASWLVPLLICLDSPQVTNESHDDGSFLHILCRPVVQSLVEAVWAGLAYLSLACQPPKLPPHIETSWWMMRGAV